MQVAHNNNVQHGHNSHNVHHGHNSHHNSQAHKCGGFADVLSKAQAAEAQSKPTEQKPAEQKPVEQTPVDQKPVDQNVAEQKPSEQKPADTKEAQQHNNMPHQPRHAAHHNHHHHYHGRFLRPVSILTPMHQHHQPIKAGGFKNVNCYLSALSAQGANSKAKASAMDSEKETLLKTLQEILSKYKIALGENEEFNVSIDQFSNITVTGENNEKAKVIEDLLKNKGVAFM